MRAKARCSTAAWQAHCLSRPALPAQARLPRVCRAPTCMGASLQALSHAAGCVTLRACRLRRCGWERASRAAQGRTCPARAGTWPGAPEMYGLTSESSSASAGCDAADATEITRSSGQDAPGMYKDLAWAHPSPVLFAAGVSAQLDLYNVA